jgi:hypothetical protein
MEFKVLSVRSKPVIEPTSQPKLKPEIQPSQLEPKRNDYDGPVFKMDLDQKVQSECLRAT